jgi:hypothetical protein
MTENSMPESCLLLLNTQQFTAPNSLHLTFARLIQHPSVQYIFYSRNETEDLHRVKTNASNQFKR